jgi:hypothetical protein
MWLSSADGQAANASYMTAMQALMEHQLDFDLFDDQSVEADLTLQGKALVNKSGSAYDTVLVPTVSALSKKTLDLLHQFHDAGGTVVFIGELPRMIPDKTFLNAPAPGDLSWAKREPVGQFAAAAVPEVHLTAAIPAVKYIHRHYQNAEGYFFFNEGDDAVQTDVSLAGGGQGQQIDLSTGASTPLGGIVKHLGEANFPLSLPPYGTTFYLLESASR